MRFLLFFCLLGLFCVPGYAIECDAGYWLNGMGECEICPAGYYCPDGVEKNLCFSGFEEYEKIGVIGLTGAVDKYSCGVSYVPPGYMVMGGVKGYFDIFSCSAGGYCPGIDYDVRVKDFVDDLGVVGLVLCGFAYSKDGAVSADDCVPCPEYEDKNYHYAGFMVSFTGSNAEACGFQLMFGGNDFVSMYDMANEAFGFEVGQLLSSYQPDHVNNTRGVFNITMQYDVAQRRYVVVAEETEAFACGAGYFNVLTAETLPDGVVAPDVSYGSMSVQDVLNICMPVGENAYSPGYEVDVGILSIVRDGFAWYACPDGTHSAGYGVGADEESDCCVDGFRSYNGVCAQMCDAGISYLKTSNGMSAPLFADKHTDHSINIKYNNKVCYVPLGVGKKSGTINVGFDGAVYHAVE